jgi:TrmH family RNA methyltransferase
LVSKSQLKLITSLQQKKYRDKTGLFVAEGPKVIAEFIKEGVALDTFFTIESEDRVASLGSDILNKYQQVSSIELQKMSFLKTANTSLAVFNIPKTKGEGGNGLIVALDAVRDPGNLGTIIRLCDWFDVSQLICSEDTTDCFNPKVVQATMGSLARIDIRYVNLSEYVKNSSLPVYGGVMDGSSVYQSTLPTEAIIVLGNEANGISEEIQKQINHPITIPQFGLKKDTESLNVATAAAVLLSEFRRVTEK